jgi:hypothetical protein
MQTASHNDVKRVFQAALEQGSPASRRAYLDGACAGDAALRRRVDELLAAHERTDLLLDRPVATLLEAANQGHDGDVDWLDFLSPPTKAGTLGRLGHYEVLEVAGHGGMGVVFRAFDDKLHRVVAVKALAPSLAASGRAREQFVREARAAAAVTHENVIAIYAVEEDGPVPYLVMPFVDGVSLAEKIRRTGPLPLAAVLRIGLHVAEGLAAAHRQGLVHRDVKPANVLLENGVERVKITDFGLARAGDDAGVPEFGLLTGTPTYMSPEQAQGQAVDARSDLFSLGSVMYAMCTGRPPFEAASTLAVLERVCGDAPPSVRAARPELPVWLDELLARLCAKAPADRPASAREVADVLARRLAAAQGRETSIAAPEAEADRRRWPAWVAVVLGGCVAALGLTEATGVSRVRQVLARTTWGERPATASHTSTTTSRGAEAAVETDEAWALTVATLPADEQARAVAARLKIRNPGFDGHFTHKTVDGHVYDFGFSSERVSDLSPVRALGRLKVLHCAGTRRSGSPLADLSPLAGLQLEALYCPETRVVDLSPLRGMPMLALDCKGTRVSDLGPLKGMSLVHLVVSDTRVSDLSPLRGAPLNLLLAESLLVYDVSPLEGMPITHLGLYRTRVSDLSPLKGMPLEYLNLTALPTSDVSLLKDMKTLRRLVLNELPLADLSALEGLRLEALQINAVPVSDLSPLAGMPLKSLRLDYTPERDRSILRSMRNLERINGTPVAEFWKGQPE